MIRLNGFKRWCVGLINDPYEYQIEVQVDLPTRPIPYEWRPFKPWIYEPGWSIYDPWAFTKTS